MKSEELNPRIRIRSPLRCDGIGRLDCAEDTESGARLAVRWLPLDANGDAAVRAGARLPEHPTLPRVRQTGQVGDKAFLAMEFPDGELLATMLGQSLSGDLLLEMGAQLADALATVHSQGVVHGEMSAESVLLTGCSPAGRGPGRGSAPVGHSAGGKAYLWDMPLVIANRLADRRGEERLMHQLVRTAPFLSPERARGAAPSPECDVYALAAIICLAGGARLPPLGTTLSVVHAIVSGEWAPEVPALFHEPYRGLLQRMLARDASKRPTSRECADLLGRPAAATPTIPEMPAVVLPSPLFTAPPALRAHVKSPFAAAPGALEPMLPPKAVADAAAKLPVKPLAVTVPTQVESTVKVSVPEQVLAAMSHPIPMDAELKAAVESLRPTPPAPATPVPAPIIVPPTTRTLEFGSAAPRREKTPSPLSLAGAKEKTPPPTHVASLLEKRAEKTPPPALAPVAAELKAALERKTPAPAIAPTFAELGRALERKTPAPSQSPLVAAVQAALDAPSAAITAPNPPPSPRKPGAAELPAPPVLLPVPPPAAEAKAAVDVHENVAISAETYAAGAGALGEDDDSPLDLVPRSAPTFLIAAALLALLTTAVAVGAHALVRHRPEPEPQASLPASEVKVTPAAAPAPSSVKAVLTGAEEEDELSALPQAPRAPARPKPAPARKASPAKLEGKYDSHNEPAPPANDFSFLDTGYEAPKEELKRPSF